MWRTTPTPSLDLLNNAQDPAAPPEVPEGAEGVAAPAAAAGVLEGVAAPGALGVEGVLSVDTTEVRGPRIRIIKIELFHSSEGRRSNLKRSPLFFYFLVDLLLHRLMRSFFLFWISNIFPSMDCLVMELV